MTIRNVTTLKTQPDNVYCNYQGGFYMISTKSMQVYKSVFSAKSGTRWVAVKSKRTANDIANQIKELGIIKDN